ncbi:MAG: hypothetical protein HQL06_17575 [Nitrospirae bacterium]|nr:hypothetical protein [Nitrospirota bacterium]
MTTVTTSGAIAGKFGRVLQVIKDTHKELETLRIENMMLRNTIRELREMAGGRRVG